MSAPERIGSGLQVLHRSELGWVCLGDSREAMAALPAGSVDLIVSSPPFEGDSSGVSDPCGAEFVAWLQPFVTEIGRVLKPRGSLILELGATWIDDRPQRRVQPFRFAAELCSGGEWHLAQEFYWYNPQLLTPKPEWDEIRFHDSVSVVWWFVRDLTVPVQIRAATGARGRAENLLRFADQEEDRRFTESLARGSNADAERFPVAMPSFFIELLTSTGDLVLDPFAGTSATGAAAEALARRWVCIERDPVAARAGLARF